jgi:hypothetical protein
MSVRSVELKPAFGWTCDECGRWNFARAVAAEGVDKAEAESHLREMLNLQPYESIPEWHGGEFLMAPTSVTCATCGAHFSTEGGDE